jgi:hypothetical protein
MSLFVYYTRKVDITKAKGKLKSWGWTKYLRQLNADSNIKTVSIVSLNYDVWLENLLDMFSIPYSIDGFSSTKEKIHIYKPHGSIAFLNSCADSGSPFRFNLSKTAFIVSSSSESINTTLI